MDKNKKRTVNEHLFDLYSEHISEEDRSKDVWNLIDPRGVKADMEYSASDYRLLPILNRLRDHLYKYHGKWVYLNITLVPGVVLQNDEDHQEDPFSKDNILITIGGVGKHANGFDRDTFVGRKKKPIE